MHLSKKEPGLVTCLGWCNKKFYSPDKKSVRFCKECKEKKARIERDDKTTIYRVGD